MQTTINNINNSVQNIFEKISLLESLAVLLQNYCLHSSLDLSRLSEKQKKHIAYEKNNVLNITELSLSTIKNIKNTNDLLEENINLLNQYANNCSRQITAKSTAN